MVRGAAHEELQSCRISWQKSLTALSPSMSSTALALQIRAFYQFHIYFTDRRILYQMGGIQNISNLPVDHYDEASYNRICEEFGMKPTSDKFPSHTGKMTAWAAYTFMCKGRQKRNTIIQGGINAQIERAE